MKFLPLFSAIGLSVTCLIATADEYKITLDHHLDGTIKQGEYKDIDLRQRGEIIYGTAGIDSVISGTVEQLNDLHSGSGSERRFFFKMDDTGELKWFSGSIKDNNWSGVWFGENGERGDFNLIATQTNTELPTYSDVIQFVADPIFSGGTYDTYNPINEDFLRNRYGTDPLAFEQVEYKKGIYVQSDSGGLPIPMSFELTFNKEFQLQNFRLGSFNNGQGTRLTTFNFDIWSEEQWVTVASFNFSPITQSRYWQKQIFALPDQVKTSKVRISATGTSDHFNGGRVLMWGLSFDK
ncbi:hypothetical protein [Pseudoalteromonas maricaloris]|uniref:hypothetical protein n=1 Tax=Pseudoalteromonas maricaloris TaxID=184924 RepID=UPI00029B4B60|nr:hypothetical protein [Pseudoalteromonas flavipulchra]